MWLLIRDRVVPAVAAIGFFVLLSGAFVYILWEQGTPLAPLGWATLGSAAAGVLSIGAWHRWHGWQRPKPMTRMSDVRGYLALAGVLLVVAVSVAIRPIVGLWFFLMVLSAFGGAALGVALLLPLARTRD